MVTLIAVLLIGIFVALSVTIFVAFGLTRPDRFKPGHKRPATVESRPTVDATGRSARWLDPRFQPAWTARSGHERRVVMVNRPEDERRILADRRLAFTS